jgi:hypothetical protein
MKGVGGGSRDYMHHRSKNLVLPTLEPTIFIALLQNNARSLMKKTFSCARFEGSHVFRGIKHYIRPSMHPKQTEYETHWKTPELCHRIT